MFHPKEQEIDTSAAQRAADFFGLSLDGLSEGDVKIRFRVVLRRSHPDMGGDGDAERIRVAQEHRDTLIRWLDDQPNPKCPVCKGKGYTRSGIISVPCTLCL